MADAKLFYMELMQKKQLTADVVAFYFAPQDAFTFIAGQYLQLVLPHDSADDRGTSRFFSLSSSPTEQYVILTIKKGPSSFKQTLFSLALGAQVRAFGPMGTFIL